jgi:thioredoxin 1
MARRRIMPTEPTGAFRVATRVDQQTASTRRDRCSKVRVMTPLTSVTQVTDADFDAVVLESDLPVLVDFWAAWCPPCRVMHPILDELAAERDDLRIVSLDVEAQQAIAARYSVLSMPTFLVFKHGEPVLKLIGSRPKRKLEQELSQVL